MNFSWAWAVTGLGLPEAKRQQKGKFKSFVIFSRRQKKMMSESTASVRPR